MTEQLDPIQQLVLDARRNQILQAATQVFAQKGFSRATIRDVAKAAGIADGTIYNYFANKDALLMALMHRMNETDQRRSQFDQATTMPFELFMAGYLRHRLAAISADGLQLFQVILSETLVNPELREQYVATILDPTFAIGEQFFAQWIADGTITNADPTLTPRALSAMALGLLVLRLLGDQPLIERWAEIPDFLTTLLLHGMKPQGDSANV